MALALLVVSLPLLAWALAHNEAVSQWLLLHAPGVRVVQPQGAVLGDFRAASVTVALPRGGQLSLTGLQWRGLDLRLDAAAPWHVGVDLASVRVQRLDLRWVPGPSDPAPLKAPTSLALPVSVRVGQLQVDEAHAPWWAPAPVQGLDLSAALGQGVGQHTVTVRHLAWSGWTVQGLAKVGASGRLPVGLSLQAQGPVAGAGQAQASVRVDGPLTDLAVDAQASLNRGSSAGQAVRARAQVQAFAPWPVSALNVSTNGLNLAALSAALPRTRLHGEVQLKPQGAHGMAAHVQLVNDRAGPWDAQALPLHSVLGDVTLPELRQASAKRPGWLVGQIAAVVRVPAQDVGPGGGKDGREDGQIVLKGGWGSGQKLLAELRGVAPGALHTRAPPLQLGGQLQVVPTLSVGPAQQLRWQMDLSAALQGLHADRARGAAQPVALTLAAQLLPEQLSVRQLRLQAGAAQAEANEVSLAWPAQQPWQARGAVRFEAFDPRVWLPWPAQVQGLNHLSGQAKGQLNGLWRGQMDAELSPSTLAGVPVQAQLQWRSPANATRMDVQLALALAGNRATAHASLPWVPGPQGELNWRGNAQWQAEVHAPALNAFQPLAPLLGGKRVAGALDAQVKGSGQWPIFQADGEVTAKGLQWQLASGTTTVGLNALHSRWQIDTRGRAGASKLDATLDLDQLQTEAVAVPQVRLRLAGNLLSHSLNLSAQGKQQATADRPASDMVRLDAALQGAFTGDLLTPNSALAWAAQVRELALRSASGTPRSYLVSQPTTVRWRRDARAQSVAVLPTQVQVMGADLALQSLNWQWPDRASDALGQVDVDVKLMPLNLSKTLASWQPKAGWGGDLVVGGQVKLAHSHRQPWAVDAQLARLSGDLSLSEPTIEGSSAQKLGITQARVQVQARQGIWTLTQAFEGRLLGVLRGRQVIHTARIDQWPTPNDRLSGELDAQISNLRPWGAWMPAGWRVSGQVQAKAQLSGTLAAPEYRGEVHGQNLGAGQALMGVNLTEGQLDLLLQGARAQLTRFVAKGGNQGGTVSAQGEAQFGASPTASLQLQIDRFALLQRVDRRVVVSGQALLGLAADEVKVEGQARVDEGLIDISRSDAPTIGDDVNVLHRPGVPDLPTAADADNDGPQHKANIRMDLDLGSALRLKGHGLDATLGGTLRFTTPNNRPTLQGTVRVDKGTFAAYGQKLLIERGSIAFTGPIENPRLDIVAMRAQSATASSSDVQVGVTITGTAQDPRVRLYSDPSMSETEKLSWLVLGRAPTGLGGADLGLLQSAAVALLSGEGTSPTDNLTRMLGLDELSVKQTDGAVRDTVVNVGKQVSRYWYVGYERNLTATGGNWQLIYRLAQRLTVRAQAGVDNAVDFIWSWRWN